MPSRRLLHLWWEQYVGVSTRHTSKKLHLCNCSSTKITFCLTAVRLYVEFYKHRWMQIYSSLLVEHTCHEVTNKCTKKLCELLNDMQRSRPIARWQFYPLSSWAQKQNPVGLQKDIARLDCDVSSVKKTWLKYGASVNNFPENETDCWLLKDCSESYATALVGLNGNLPVCDFEFWWRERDHWHQR